MIIWLKLLLLLMMNGFTNTYTILADQPLSLHPTIKAVPTDVLNLRLALAMGATLMFGVQMSAIKIKRDAKREAAFLKELGAKAMR